MADLVNDKRFPVNFGFQISGVIGPTGVIPNREWQVLGSIFSGENYSFADIVPGLVFVDGNRSRFIIVQTSVPFITIKEFPWEDEINADPGGLGYVFDPSQVNTIYLSGQSGNNVPENVSSFLINKGIQQLAFLNTGGTGGEVTLSSTGCSTGFTGPTGSIGPELDLVISGTGPDLVIRKVRAMPGITLSDENRCLDIKTNLSSNDFTVDISDTGTANDFSVPVALDTTPDGQSLVEVSVGPRLVTKSLLSKNNTLTFEDLGQGQGVDVDLSGITELRLNRDYKQFDLLSGVDSGLSSQLFYKISGGLLNDEGTSIIESSDGGCFVTGFISGTGPVDVEDNPRDFDGNLLLNLQNQNIFVAKFDVDGNQIFYRTSSSDGVAKSLDISSDNNGGCFVTGKIDPNNNTIDFEGNALSGPPATESIFAARLDFTGDQVFYKISGANLPSSGNNIIATEEGGCFVSGFIANSMSSNPKDFNQNTILGGRGNNDIFVSKLGPTGEQKFYIFSGGAGDDEGITLANSSDGGCLIAGYIDSGVLNGGVGNDPRDFNGAPVAKYGNQDIFVSKISENGEQIFYKVAGGNNNERGLQVVAADDGGCFITGYINSGTGATITPVINFEGISASTFSEEDIFVSRLGPTGEQIYFKVNGGLGNDRGVSIASNNNFCFVAGYVSDSSEIRDFNNKSILGRGEQDIFVAKLSPTGDQIFYKTSGGSLNDQGLNISVSENGSCFVTGFIDTSSSYCVDFDDNQIFGYGGNDIFVAQLNEIGEQLFYKISGSQTGDKGVSIVRSTTDSGCYITGFVNSVVNTDFEENVTTNYGNKDIFLSKLRFVDNDIESFGLVLEDTENEITSVAFSSSVINGNDYNLIPNTNYYLKNNILTSDKTDFYAGFTTTDNRFVVQLQNLEKELENNSSEFNLKLNNVAEKFDILPSTKNLNFQSFIKTGILGKTTSFCYDIKQNKNNEIFVGGYFVLEDKTSQFITDFAGNQIENILFPISGNLPASYYTAFIVKFDKDGNQLFFKIAGGYNPDYNTTLVTDNQQAIPQTVNSIEPTDDGGCLVVGNIAMAQAKDFEGNPIPDISASIFNDSGEIIAQTIGFVAKFDSNGNQIFIKTCGKKQTTSTRYIAQQGCFDVKIIPQTNEFFVCGNVQVNNILGENVPTLVQDFENNIIDYDPDGLTSGVQTPPFKTGGALYFAKFSENGEQIFIKFAGCNYNINAVRGLPFMANSQSGSQIGNNTSKLIQLKLLNDNNLILVSSFTYTNVLFDFNKKVFDSRGTDRRIFSSDNLFLFLN